jgi:glycosyltransferase involved in cell wall biosynthesis
MPRFTIGIPTYNRPKTLRRSIDCAVNQSHPDVEVIVSDDGSSDETSDVVKSFGDRVRYHRNPKNIGMWQNFLKLPELASGEYFAWLQDDDLLHRDFAKRAVEAWDSDAAIAMYTAYEIDSYSHETFIMPKILGPPIAMNWMNPEVRVIDGSIVLPISFFLTFSMPPITAYRTELLREVAEHIDPAHILYNERILQSRVVAGRKIAVDPWTAGIFYKHEAQGSLLNGSTDLAERSRQWVDMVNEISILLEARPADEWRPQVDDWLKSVARHDIMTIYHHLAPPAYWSRLRPLALEVCTEFLEYLPEAVRREHKEALALGMSPRRIIKDFGRQLLPPLVWDFLMSFKSKTA